MLSLPQNNCASGREHAQFKTVRRLNYSNWCNVRARFVVRYNPSKGFIVAVDRGYCDYDWYNRVTEKKVFFVTHLKNKAKYKVVSRESTLKHKGLTSDQAIKFTGLKSAKESCNILFGLSRSAPVG